VTTRLAARTGPPTSGDRGTDLDLDLDLAVGGAAVLPDRAEVVAWFAGRRRAAPGDDLRVDGRRLTHRSAAARVRAGLVVVGDPPLAPAVSVVDHLAAITSRGAALALLAQVPRLAGRGDDPAGVLSGGERRLLGWARAILLGPRVAVLDRAATGLDTDAVAWAGAQVARWRAGGTVALVRVGRAEEAGWARGGP
jgi:ABC-type branched-subunit amino acid transport system ATPase component